MGNPKESVQDALDAVSTWLEERAAFSETPRRDDLDVFADDGGRLITQLSFR